MHREIALEGIDQRGGERRLEDLSRLRLRSGEGDSPALGLTPERVAERETGEVAAPERARRQQRDDEPVAITARLATGRACRLRRSTTSLTLLSCLSQDNTVSKW